MFLTVPIHVVHEKYDSVISNKLIFLYLLTYLLIYKIKLQ